MKSIKRRRNSLRLAGYDYTSPGDYYVTICTYQREPYLSNIEDRKVVLLPFGVLAKRCWDALPHHYPNLALGEFVVMPNHVHGIIKITEEKNDVHTLIYPRSCDGSKVFRGDTLTGYDR
jgi:putative transposase